MDDFRALLATLFLATITSACFSQIPAELKLTPQQWHEDLLFYARELPARHLNAFHYTSKEAWEAAVAKLDATLAHADADQVYVGFRRLSALIGDGHTAVSYPPDWAGKTIFPLVISRFNNEYRVIKASPELQRAIGSRVVRINSTTIDDAVTRLMLLTPQDELPALQSLLVESMLVHPRILHGDDILPTHDAATYTLVDDAGREFSVEAHAVPTDSAKIDDWPMAYSSPPLSAQHPTENFYFQYLAESRTVYCNVRLIRDLDAPSKNLVTYLNQHQNEIDKLVIDLRQNGGGDFNVGIKRLVHPLRDLGWLNKKGHLFVLIGPRTFSAAMSNATHFRAQTNAILVGMPVGEKPNSSAEKRTVNLPNSHWVASYSIRFYKFVDESSENIVRPDQQVEQTWEQFKQGADPALEWVLSGGRH
jgi:hypothetical protein